MCFKAFSVAKQLLSSDNLLVHYDPQLPLTLATDASAYGIEAVISHVLPDKPERPVACSLSTAECHYAQVEKEALAIYSAWDKKVLPISVWLKIYPSNGSQGFDNYILGPKTGVPKLAAFPDCRYGP